ncbi:hypothetical protein F2Q69_00043854 [Brassica cretica]|uniref:Uncharacterized protein n=1 Tax=Brassica cretica TaxID=69181 RepID=A0A8S9NDF9_BRACR|nr:hypothetical protein F2Q69_00043854 [Brassica cretica]
MSFSGLISAFPVCSFSSSDHHYVVSAHPNQTRWRLFSTLGPHRRVYAHQSAVLCFTLQQSRRCEAEHGGLMSIDTTVRLERAQETPPCLIGCCVESMSDATLISFIDQDLRTNPLNGGGNDATLISLIDQGMMIKNSPAKPLIMVWLIGLFQCLIGLIHEVLDREKLMGLIQNVEALFQIKKSVFEIVQEKPNKNLHFMVE